MVLVESDYKDYTYSNQNAKLSISSQSCIGCPNDEHNLQVNEQETVWIPKEKMPYSLEINLPKQKRVAAACISATE